MSFTLRITIVVALALSCGAVVEAQVYSTGPAGLAQQMPRIYGPYLANISRVRILQKQGKTTQPKTGGVKRPTGQTPPTSRRPPTAPNPGTTPGQDTTFHSVEPSFVPQQLAARLGKTDEERRQIETILSKCLTFYTDTAKKQGVPLHDVARALNYYISTNYFVYSQGAGPTKQQMDATRSTIKANMLNDDTFVTMSDHQKQEAYETLIVLAGFVDLGYGTAKQSGDDNTASAFREMARHNLETLLGVPIDNIRFTNAGLTLN